MNYWLMKSEPTTFGIEHLKKAKNQTYRWDGVRNYQARNMMRDDMAIGDRCFFYHSNCEVPGIVGIMEVVKKAYPDHTAFDPDSKYHDPKSNPDNPRWFMVDVKLIKTFEHIIPLKSLRENPKLSEMILLRKGNRLSITPVTKNQWDAILRMHET